MPDAVESGQLLIRGRFCQRFVVATDERVVLGEEFFAGDIEELFSHRRREVAPDFVDQGTADVEGGFGFALLSLLPGFGFSGLARRWASLGLSVLLLLCRGVTAGFSGSA